MGCCASTGLEDASSQKQLFFRVYEIKKVDHATVIEALNKVEKTLSTKIQAGTRCVLGCTAAKKSRKHVISVLVAVSFESAFALDEERGVIEAALDAITALDAKIEVKLETTAVCDVQDMDSICRGNAMRVCQYQVNSTRDQAMRSFEVYKQAIEGDCALALERKSATGFAIGTPQAGSYAALMTFRDEVSRDSFSSIGETRGKAAQKQIKLADGSSVNIQANKSRRDMVRECASRNDSSSHIVVESVICKKKPVTGPWFKGAPAGSPGPVFGQAAAAPEEEQSSPHASPSWFGKKPTLASQDVALDGFTRD